MTKSLKRMAKEIFRKTKSVECPAFTGEKISFNSKGLNHLFYRGHRRPREPKQSAIRIKLLPRAIKMLMIMPIYQDEISYVVGGRKFRFWSFEGVADGRRIKVIVKQIGSGKKHFWSVIPSWRVKRIKPPRRRF
jgi:hypothetical protein